MLPGYVGTAHLDDARQWPPRPRAALGRVRDAVSDRRVAGPWTTRTAASWTARTTDRAVHGSTVHRIHESTESTDPRTVTVRFAGLQASLPNWSEEALAEVTLGAWQPTRAIVDETLATYRGGWLEQLPARSAMALGFETFMLVIWGMWRAGGLMLIGMALYKLDVFSARRSPRFYGALVAAALVAGIPVEAYGIALDLEFGWALDWSLLQGRQFNYWPSIAVGLGYVGLVMLACRTAALRPIARAFAAVGRTALSNYLLQTVICTTIFYGHGLGLYGSVDRVGQLAIVLGVWAVQLIASPIWLRRYRFGPGRMGMALAHVRETPAVPACSRTGELRPVTGQGSRPSTSVSIR